MALIALRKVNISFGGAALLDAVDLRIEPGERVCLVGRNGAGKTTLLRIIAGEIAPDSGVVETGESVRISGLPQDVREDLSGTCLDVVAGGLDEAIAPKEEQLHRVNEVISRLSLDGSSRVEELSGGLKRRALLARALVSEPDILLLDEPTNHLDVESIEWLEQFLLRYKATLLFITHDRYFLQRLATRIIDLDNGKLTSWPGDFASYKKKKHSALDVEEQNQIRFDKKMAEEEVWIRKGIKARRTRNEGRVRALQKMRDIVRQRRVPTGAAQIHIQEAGRTSKKVVALKDTSFRYRDGPAIIEHFSTTVYRGDKIGIVGKNGSGKTTLIRLMLGDLKPSRGTVTISEQLEVAYLGQLRHQLDEEKTVIDNVLASGDQVIVDGRPRHIITYLRDFLFSPDRARSPAWVLSGGEKNRLLLAKLFTRPANVLVLDEPTNDLDTETLELLEERILEFNGTVLLVSHDRAFLNNSVTSTLVFEDGGSIGEYAGGYDDWMSQRAPQAKTHRAKPRTRPRPKRPPQPRRLTFKEKHELEQLPSKIEALEAEQARLHADMADPDFYRNSGDKIAPATSRLEEIEAQLKEAYGTWEELESIKEDGK